MKAYTLGGSTAINVAGAVAMARELGPGHTIVTILCDPGPALSVENMEPGFFAVKRFASAKLAVIFDESCKVRDHSNKQREC